VPSAIIKAKAQLKMRIPGITIQSVWPIFVMLSLEKIINLNKLKIKEYIKYTLETIRLFRTRRFFAVGLK